MRRDRPKTAAPSLALVLLGVSLAFWLTAFQTNIADMPGFLACAASTALYLTHRFSSSLRTRRYGGALLALFVSVTALTAWVDIADLQDSAHPAEAVRAETLEPAAVALLLVALLNVGGAFTVRADKPLNEPPPVPPLNGEAEAAKPRPTWTPALAARRKCHQCGTPLSSLHAPCENCGKAATGPGPAGSATGS